MQGLSWVTLASREALPLTYSHIVMLKGCLLRDYTSWARLPHSVRLRNGTLKG